MPRSSTIDALTRLAEKREAEAEGAPPEKAVELLREALTLRRAVEEMAKALSPPNHSGKLRAMVTAERVRHSKGSTGDDPFRAAVNAAHYTIRSLAEKLGVSHAHLSQARRGHTSIAKALADEIQKLTGFPATKHNWPKIKG